MLLHSTSLLARHSPDNPSYIVAGPIRLPYRTASTARSSSLPRQVSGGYLANAKSPSGFSLIEVVIVIALSGIVLALGLLLSLDVYRGTVFRSTRSILVSSLTTARARALSNQYQSPHGVCYSAPDFIVFRGSSFSTAQDKERISGNPAVTLTSPSSFFTCGTGTGILFTQVSATTTNTGVITVTESGHADETVSVNALGTIVW